MGNNQAVPGILRDPVGSTAKFMENPKRQITRDLDNASRGPNWAVASSQDNEYAVGVGNNVYGHGNTATTAMGIGVEKRL